MGERQFMHEATHDEIDQLLREMNESGVGRLANFVPHDTMAAARRYIAGRLREHSNDYFCYSGRNAVKGSVIADLGNLLGLRKILEEV